MNRSIGRVVRTTGSLLLLVAATLPAQTTPGGTAPSVTLFNSGRVLVRRTVPTAIRAGTASYPLALGAIDLASLTPLDPGVTLLRVSSDQAWSEDALLRRNIGKSFDLVAGDRPARRATLLSMDPERWEWADGGVVFGRPGQVIWPKDLVPATRIADVTLQADRARDALRVMYQTDGGSWSALYRLFVGSGRLEGVASMSAGSLDLDNAEVQLLAGNIGTAGPYPAPVPYAKTAGAMMAQAPRADVASSESVGEAHVYTLPRPVSFAAGVVVVEPLFQPATVRAARHYTVGGAMSMYGMLPAGADEQDLPVEVSWRLDHGAGTAFGDLPLPGGMVEVYDSDRGGRPQLIGVGAIDHTAAGESLEVATGTAFDVTARRVQTEYSTTRTSGTVSSPARTVATVAYRVTLQNARDSAVTVEVREDRAGEWTVIDSSVPAEKRSSTRVVFPVTIPSKGIAVLTYRVRVTW